MSKVTSNEQARPSLPLNARTKLRDQLLNLACSGEFAGSLALDPSTTPLPVISFQKTPTTRAEKVLFPLAKSQQEALVQASSRACVGAGDKTVVNLDVRRCWHLLPDDFSIDNACVWDESVMKPLLAEITTALGVQQWAPVQADLYKLLLYEDGCFFKRHRDNERLDGCFGTLVIQLPSQFQGAELTVYQPSDLINASSDTSTAMRFSVQGPRAEKGMHAFFFFADCYHEVEKLTSGARLALVYTLFHRDADAALAGADRGGTQEQGGCGHQQASGRKRKADEVAAGNSAPSKGGGLLNQRVVVTGLETRDGLNGRHGFVSSWDARTGRYTVRMEGSKNEEDWNLIPANLRPWTPGAAAHRVAAEIREDVARIQVPSTRPPQPVDSDIASQIASAVCEWELETPLAYHRVKDASTKDEQGCIHFESSMQKPHKFVAILSHNYTPDALKEGLHALKGRDRILANLLDAARRVDLVDLTQDAVIVAALAGTPQVEEPYAFDVFLTMLTGVERGNSEGTQKGCFTTGALIPLLPGDPGAFKALLDAKANYNVAPCWYPTSFDGMDIANALTYRIQSESDGRDPHKTMNSLNKAGLLDPLTGRPAPGFTDPDDKRWNKWKTQNRMGPDVLCEPCEDHDVNAGDLHIGLNELLLTDKDCYNAQQHAALNCSFSAGGCECNAMEDFSGHPLNSPKKIEFTGNSMIFDPGRWYSRAALVFWPRAHRPTLLEKLYDEDAAFARMDY